MARFYKKNKKHVITTQTVSVIQGLKLTFQFTSLVASDNLDITTCTKKKVFTNQVLMLAING